MVTPVDIEGDLAEERFEGSQVAVHVADDYQASGRGAVFVSVTGRGRRGVMGDVLGG